MTETRQRTLADVVKAGLRASLADLRVALPGRIERYDASKQLADVAPLLKDQIEGPDGKVTAVGLPVLTGVPVVFPGGGGFRLTFPVQRGDLVLLVFSDRSLDKWLSGDGREVDPGASHMHSIADAVALPGLHTFGAPAADAGTASLKVGVAGGVQIEISSAEIKLAGGSAGVARVGDSVAPTVDFGAWLTAVATFTGIVVPPSVAVSGIGAISTGSPTVKA